MKPQFFYSTTPYIFSLVLCLFLIYIPPLNAQADNYQKQIKSLQQENLQLKEEVQRLTYSNTVMEHNLRERAIGEATSNRQTGNELWVAVVCILITFFATKYKSISSFLQKDETVKNNEQLTVDDEAIEKDLTEREMDVLLQLSMFKSNPEIADSLFISTNTAKTHVASILKKLKASNRQEAVHKASCLKLIPKKMNSYNNLIVLVLMMSFFFGEFPALNAQDITLKNTTTCTYLIKANVLGEGDCQLKGKGPLLKLLPNSTINLPGLPLNSWLAAYGVEEVEGEKLLNPVLVGRRDCNFKSSSEDYGTCNAKIEYFDQSLKIEAEN